MSNKRKLKIAKSLSADIHDLVGEYFDGGEAAVLVMEYVFSEYEREFTRLIKKIRPIVRERVAVTDQDHDSKHYFMCRFLSTESEKLLKPSIVIREISYLRVNWTDGFRLPDGLEGTRMMLLFHRLAAHSSQQEIGRLGRPGITNNGLREAQESPVFKRLQQEVWAYVPSTARTDAPVKIHISTLESGDVLATTVNTVDRWTSYTFLPKAIVSRLANRNPEAAACIPITTNGHIWMMIHNRDGKIELFDPSGGVYIDDLLPVVVHLTKRDKFRYLQHNFQDSKEDMHCQTWIWYYAYCRLIRKEDDFEFHCRMRGHSGECRVAILRCFRDMLQSSRDGRPADFTVARLHEAEQATTASACLWPDVDLIARRLRPSAFR